MHVISRRNFVNAGVLGLAASHAGPLFKLERLMARIQQEDPSLARRKEYLAILQRVIEPGGTDRFTNAANDLSWEAWQKRTGELPPDFSLMPSRSILPDPLVMLQPGPEVPIRNMQQWERQRQLIREAYEHWIVGRMPPAPDNMKAEVVSSVIEADTTVKQILLSFGPEQKATLRLQLQIPQGDGPFPVFVTNHQRGRPWVNTAIRRGYAGCIYHAIDRGYGIGDDSEKWLTLYPDYDFTAVGRWAWGGMRAVDYLMTQPWVDRKRIAIGGHSRNSKQALLAAAFDTRIGAVAASRGNTGDTLPWRFTEDWYVQESIEELSRWFSFWFHPRIRFFVGREDKLPVDQNLLMSMVAPRGLLVSHAFQEHQGNPLGVEQAFRSARRVYRWMGKEQNIGLYQQPGEHPSSAEDVEQYFDFFDTVFDRKRFPVPTIFVHGYEFTEWKARSREKIDPMKFRPRTAAELDAMDPEAMRKDVRSRVEWILGEEPPELPMGTTTSVGNRYGSEGWRGQMYVRPGPGYDAFGQPFGDDLAGFFYRPDGAREQRAAADTARRDYRRAFRADSIRAVRADSARAVRGDTTRIPIQLDSATVALQKKSEALRDAADNPNWPVVIWLHPYSYATGFNRYVYFGPLYQRGFSVFTFDQIGFGSRADYPLRFYDRYPRWSLLGKMVADTRAAIHALTNTDRGRINPARIYLQGYGLGAKIALMTAALDDRVAGVTVSTGIAPLRSARTRDETEGLRHYSHVHGLMPRLGHFIGHEDRVPVDYDEILASIAPRPVHIVAPTMDRHAPVDEVRKAVETARRTYARLGKPDALSLETPENFNRFPAVWMKQCDWLTTTAGLTIPPARTRAPGP